MALLTATREWRAGAGCGRTSVRWCYHRGGELLPPASAIGAGSFCHRRLPVLVLPEGTRRGAATCICRCYQMRGEVLPPASVGATRGTVWWWHRRRPVLPEARGVSATRVGLGEVLPPASAGSRCYQRCGEGAATGDDRCCQPWGCYKQCFSERP
jgi:hypothetical protein